MTVVLRLSIRQTMLYSALLLAAMQAPRMSSAAVGGHAAPSAPPAEAALPIPSPASPPKVPTQAAQPVADGEVEQRLGRRLRCPVCQGMSIGDSPAAMAQDMMRQVRRMHAAGESEQAIVAHFTARYGDWVLLDPPVAGFGLWAWLLPPVALALGLLVAWRRARQLPGHLTAPSSVASVALRRPQAPQAGASDASLLATIRAEVDHL